MSIDRRSQQGRRHLKALRQSALLVLAITEGHETNQQAAHALFLSNKDRAQSHDADLVDLTISCNSAIAAFAHLIDQYRLILEDDRAPKKQLPAESLLEECSYVTEQTWSLK